MARHFWVVHLLFIACAAWLIAHLSILFIEDRVLNPPLPNSSRKASSLAATAQEPYEKYSAITERNIFSPADRGQKLLPLGDRKAHAPGSGAAEAGQDAASGNYVLAGTITGPEGYSWAILQERGSRKQQIFRIHGNIDGGKIVSVTRKQIQIEKDGKRETLILSEETPQPPRPAGKPIPPPPPAPAGKEEVKKLSANRFLVNREDVSSAVGDINRFMTQARLRPHFEMGKPAGYSVSEIVPGSLMEKLGLKNNDIIRKVNGMAVSRPEEVMQAYAQFQQDSNIELEIDRGGRTEILRYEIR
ncbi:MAG: PDZ domain-containing protein [Syntrophaceae bacterium]|nr:PDZ domain-containing protein [Syntrophaceae bacterium]